MASGLDPIEASATSEEIRSVKSVITSLLAAMKNYTLYPENHAISEKSITNLGTRLDDFFDGHDRLRFDVEKDRLIFGNEEVHQDLSAADNLAFPLFRDGIEWLEFQKGISPSEIATLVHIINKYKDDQEEAEGDLVTALWESKLPNVQWKAHDVLWDSEPMLDLSALSPGEVKQPSTDQSAETEDVPVTESQHVAELGVCQLTAEDKGKLRQLILEEEKRDTAQDLLDVLLVVIDDQREENDLTATLEFLADEFKDALAHGEFRFGFKLLEELHAIRRTYKNERPWAVPLLHHFFLKVSSPQVLDVLSSIVPSIDAHDSDRMKLLQQSLLLLPPKVILVLGPLLVRIRCMEMQKQLMKIIAIQAQRDLRPLEQLMNSPEENMVQRLVYILGHLKGDKPVELLLKLIHHDSARIRRQALRHVMVKGEHVLKKLFSLIEDPEESVRRLVLRRLGEERDELAEGLLLDYLEQGRCGSKDHRHILACYTALGRCGSSRSIPLLRRALFNGSLLLGFGGSIHRRGAVVALNALGTEEAQEILQKASRSLSPGVKLAYRRGLEASP